MNMKLTLTKYKVRKIQGQRQVYATIIKVCVTKLQEVWYWINGQQLGLCLRTDYLVTAEFKPHPL